MKALRLIELLKEIVKNYDNLDVDLAIYGDYSSKADWYNLDYIYLYY